MTNNAVRALFAHSKADSEQVISVRAVSEASLTPLLSEQPSLAAWVTLNRFSAKAGDVLLVPGKEGEGLACVLLGMGDGNEPLCAGALAKKLPAGLYHLDGINEDEMELALIGFGLGAYRFERYKQANAASAQLLVEQGTMLDRAVRAIAASWLARDLVNTPANDMGPDAIEAAAAKLAKAHKATIKVTRGDDLLKANLPMVHAVGRASTTPPRLIDFTWGNRKAPKLTLVGKGVAYDTGGLNIKPGSSMRNMKKDMGGAAHVLALAQMIMQAKLNVRLRVLIPAVENSIAGNAFRPGDVLPTRKGLTVEIGNTDAEGRLVLADALTLADEEKPDRIIDMATLTGAARVALGPDVPPFYSTDDAFADALAAASVACHDPMWRLPLWQPYAPGLKSHVADLCNITTDGMAGSITAALFLQRFVEHTTSWSHFDVFAWSNSAKPHAAIGAEAQGIRALFDAIAADLE